MSVTGDFVGLAVGGFCGDLVGKSTIVGKLVEGASEGESVTFGSLVGNTVMAFLGLRDGDNVGSIVRFSIGLAVGSSVAIVVGVSVIGSLFTGVLVWGDELGRESGCVVGKPVKGASVGDWLCEIV